MHVHNYKLQQLSLTKSHNGPATAVRYT